MMHAANLCELYYDFTRAAGVDCGEQAVADFMRLGVVVRDDMDFDFWKSAGYYAALKKMRATIQKDEIMAILAKSPASPPEPSDFL